jgi:nitronate monooxygenase
METMSAPGVEILPYPLQGYLVRNVSNLAEKAGRADLMTMWAGQSANLARDMKATELLDSLVSEVSALINEHFGSGR